MTAQQCDHSHASIIGLIDEDGSGGDDPLRLQLEDDFSTDRSFFEIRDRDPWEDYQPDDRNNRENCVE